MLFIFFFLIYYKKIFDKHLICYLIYIKNIPYDRIYYVIEKDIKKMRIVIKIFNIMSGLFNIKQNYNWIVYHYFISCHLLYLYYFSLIYSILGVQKLFLKKERGDPQTPVLLSKFAQADHCQLGPSNENNYNSKFLHYKSVF